MSQYWPPITIVDLGAVRVHGGGDLEKGVPREISSDDRRQEGCSGGGDQTGPLMGLGTRVR